jgi:hypothetical protein
MTFIETHTDLIEFVHRHKPFVITASIIIFFAVWIVIEIKNAPEMPEDYED